MAEGSTPTRRRPGMRVLELGCGLGLPSIVAARAGAEVLATDGSTDAIAYTAHSLALNGTEADVAAADWAADGDALVERGPFDLVLGADVLYTKANAARRPCGCSRGWSPRAARRGSPTPAAATAPTSSPPSGRPSTLQTRREGELSMHVLTPR